MPRQKVFSHHNPGKTDKPKTRNYIICLHLFILTVKIGSWREISKERQ